MYQAKTGQVITLKLQDTVILFCSVEGHLYGSRRGLELVRIEGLAVGKAAAAEQKTAAGATAGDSKLQPASGAGAAAAEAPKTLAALFKQLDCEKYLADFEKQELSLADLEHLAADDLKTLFPVMGPRGRLQRWIAQNWPK